MRGAGERRIYPAARTVAKEGRLSLARLKALLHYDPDTGDFTWIARPCTKPRWTRISVGDKAGSFTRGYIDIGIDGCSYRAHRLAWLYVHGTWPDGLLDHINGKPSDNRINNLRIATPRQNVANSSVRKTNKSGLKGASFHKRSGLWRSRINVNGREVTRYFTTAEEAHKAYGDAARELYGEYARAQ